MNILKKIFDLAIRDKIYILITPTGFNKGHIAILKKNTLSQFIGTYEKNLIPHIVSNTKNIIKLNSKPIIFDIGSSYGYYTLFFSKFKNCKVVSFEPDLKPFEILKKIQKRRKNLFLENSEINEDHKKNCIDFKSAISKFGKPNLIKIDIEGYEKRLLLNNTDYFKKNKTIIIVEVHSLEIENSLKDAFEKIGYIVKIINNDEKTLKIRKVEHNRWLILYK